MKRIVYVVIAVVIAVSVLIASLGIWYIFTHGGGVGPRRVGQAVNLLGLEITVLSVTKTDRYQCGPEEWNYRVADPGEDLIIADIKMKNTADYPVAFTGLGHFIFYMVNSYGTRYDFTMGDSVCLGESWTVNQYVKSLRRFSGYDVLPSGTEVRGKEMFRVPENSPGLEIVLSLMSITSYHGEGEVIHGVREGIGQQKISWKL